MSLLIYFTTLRQELRQCYHVTMNNPHLPLFPKLMQRLCNVVLSTSKKRCQSDVTASTLYQRYHCNIYDILQREPTIQR